MVSEEDRFKLQNFVLSVQEDLGIIISKIYILAPEREELYDLLNKSWEEVGPRFSDINDYI